MIRNLSLVTADIAWPSFNNDNMQCLVTWEVSGGGLMGNLLTETSSVELSLWPETKYRIQVTCKNKVSASASERWSYNPLNKRIFSHPPQDSEALTRSLPLTLDTHYAIIQLATTSAPELAASSSAPDAAVIVTPATVDTMKSIVSADTRESTSSSSNSNSNGHGSGSSTSSINHNQHKHRVQQKEDENNDEWQHLDEQPAPSHHHSHHQQQHFQQSSSSSSAAHHHQQTASAAEILYEEYPATTSALSTFGNNIWNILIRRKEAALGLCIGILGFFIVILALSIVLRRRKSRSNDKENLIENEFMADVNSQILHV